MINIKDVEVIGMRKAIQGMRNALNSWNKSDSKMDGCYAYGRDCDVCAYKSVECNNPNHFFIGEEDMKLCKRLIKAGSSDRKFMRMIHVQTDVTAPLYWWKEYDTYKVGTTSNSCSTMHTIHKKELTLEDFSHEHLFDTCLLEAIINDLNIYRYIFDNYEDMPNYNRRYTKKEIWWQMIQLLPSSFNQMRTIDLDYETLFSIYHQRKNHKLDEWKEFCKWIEELPYMKEFLEA